MDNVRKPSENEPGFTEELSDEALDRADGGACLGWCWSHRAVPAAIPTTTDSRPLTGSVAGANLLRS